MSTLMQKVIDGDGFVIPAELAEVFHVAVSEVAGMSNVPIASLQRPARFRSIKTQSKLKHLIEIINMVKPWAGSDLQAYAWYRSEPIPAFGDITAESAVKLGHAQLVKDYVQGLAMGGYA